jgi:hypothetical protein
MKVHKKFQDAAKAIGLHSYEDYLKLEHWQSLISQYKKSRMPQKCISCDNDGFILVGLNPNKLNNESLTDLVPLCFKCNNSVFKLQRKMPNSRIDFLLKRINCWNESDRKIKFLLYISDWAKEKTKNEQVIRSYNDYYKITNDIENFRNYCREGYTEEDLAQIYKVNINYIKGYLSKYPEQAIMGYYSYTDEIAREIGYQSYKHYLSSKAWSDMRKKYKASNMPKYCVGCAHPKYQLHHVGYGRMGCELLTDLVPICKKCHYKVHRFEKNNRIDYALQEMFNWKDKDREIRFEPYLKAWHSKEGLIVKYWDFSRPYTKSPNQKDDFELIEKNIDTIKGYIRNGFNMEDIAEKLQTGFKSSVLLYHRQNPGVIK